VGNNALYHILEVRDVIKGINFFPKIRKGEQAARSETTYMPFLDVEDKN